MASAAAASLRGQTYLGVPKPPTVPAFTPQTFTPGPVPTAPQTGVYNPATAAQEQLILSQLDPSSPAYIGGKYKPGVAQAGTQLQQGLAGLGPYRFTPTGELGALQVERDTSRANELGERYRQEAWRALAQANARGMLYSRSADQAVGAAWHRLSEEERGQINAYSQRLSGHLGDLANEMSTLTYNLTGLYGQDVQYALENPILPPEQETATTPAEAAPVSGARPTARGTRPAPLTSGGRRAPGTNIVVGQRWVGESRPDLAAIARAWGMRPSGLRVTRSGEGKYVVTPSPYGGSLTTR